MFDIDKILKELTLEEKADLCSGLNFWQTKPVERLGIPSIRVSDGPHGLRKLPVQSHLWERKTVKSICFPTASALASSWDRELVHQVGSALGDEAQSMDVDIILGPGMNMKRTPLCGRNFEYFSEDSYLTGEIASAMVEGIQSKGVGACIKHFACNNQETERMTVSVQVDERAFHETYLAAFEHVIAKTNPWSIMCAYNWIDGIPSSENKNLLTDILRDKWGYDGAVISDWAAVINPENAVAAGLNLEMPGTGEKSKIRLLKALEDGTLKEDDLNRSVKTLLSLIKKAVENRKEGISFDPEAHHALARKAAAESMVLLKNEGKLLPLSAEKYKKVAVIGAFAKTPRFQGGGSSHVDVLKVESPYENLQTLAPGMEFTYAPGYDLADTENAGLINQAVNSAKQSDCALIFAGLPDAYEMESADRHHLNIPKVHNNLIEKIAAVQKNCIVVLINGSVVTLEQWVNKIPALLEACLGGEAAGGAVADVLLGKINPSGKLTESFPVRLEDTPAYLNFPGTDGKIHYGEGIFVGYRYYDKKKIPVRFSFGHGLSYTQFEYSNLETEKTKITENQALTVRFRVKNRGSLKGKEICQIYVEENVSTPDRPEKQLAGFAKIELTPEEEKKVQITLPARAFQYYDSARKSWCTRAGEYRILVGASSTDNRLTGSVHLNCSLQNPLPYTLQSWLSAITANPTGHKLLEKLVNLEEVKSRIPSLTVEKLFHGGDVPIGRLMNLSGGILTRDMLQEVVDKLNGVSE